MKGHCTHAYFEFVRIHILLNQLYHWIIITYLRTATARFLKRKNNYLIHEAKCVHGQYVIQVLLWYELLIHILASSIMCKYSMHTHCIHRFNPYPLSYSIILCVRELHHTFYHIYYIPMKFAPCKPHMMNQKSDKFHMPYMILCYTLML